MPFLFEELAAAITAKRLQTPLDQALWLESDEPPRTAARRLKKQDFDRAPVRRGAELAGFADRQTLATTLAREVADCTVPLTPAVLVSATAGLPTLLPVLGTTGMVFVLDGHEVSGFITPSDLNKQLARMHFFLLTGSLEVLLAGLVRWAYPKQEGALTSLSPERADRVRERLARDLDANVALDLVTEMEFTDLLRVVAGAESLRTLFGYASRQSFLTATGHLSDLRNDVMHPSRQFLGRRRDVAKLIEIEQQLRTLIGAAATQVGRTDRWLAASLLG